MVSTNNVTEISANELRTMVENNNLDSNAVILDVRTPNEFMQDGIEGAVNIDIYSPQFADKIDALDRSQTYYVVCRSGGRSSSAVGFMASKDFNKVINVSGGMMSY